MDRRWIMVPAVAVTAGAQTPGMADAEKALRSRAEEFFRYQVEQKYRQAESLVAEESKDEYYAAHKPRIDGFTVSKVEFLENGTKAQVTIIAKTVVNMIGAGPTPFDVPSPSSWKLENGKWVWYLDKDLYRKTPFGEAKAGGGAGASTVDPSQAFKGAQGSAPSMEELRKQIQVEPKVVELVPGGPGQKVRITNGLKGPLRFQIEARPTPVPGLTMDKDTLNLAANGTGEFLFNAKAGAQFDETLILLIQPFGLKARLMVKTVGKPK